MLKLEDIKRGSQIAWLVPMAIATISVAEMVYRDDEHSLSLAEAGLAWSFDSPSREFKLDKRNLTWMALASTRNW